MNFSISSGGRPPGRPKKVARKRAASQQRFFRLVDEVGAWASEHKEKVAYCFLSPKTDGIALHAVTKEVRFDFDLNERLSDLCIRLGDMGLSVFGDLVPLSLEAEIDQIESAPDVLQVAPR